jgi:ketosteroid isomerase-like protein
VLPASLRVWALRWTGADQHDVAVPMAEGVDHERAIQRLIVAYADAVDDRDFAVVAACFTDDASASYSGRELAPGVDAIVAHVRGLERFVATTHQISNVTVDVAADGRAARARSTAVAWLVAPGDPPPLLVRGLRYHDELRRDDGVGWRITRRVHTVRWMWEGTAQVPTDPDAVTRALASRADDGAPG